MFIPVLASRFLLQSIEPFRLEKITNDENDPKPPAFAHASPEYLRSGRYWVTIWCWGWYFTSRGGDLDLATRTVTSANCFLLQVFEGSFRCKVNRRAFRQTGRCY